VAPTVIIGECGSCVPNLLLGSGSTISDLIGQAALDARNHGQSVSSVASISSDLKKSGVITEGRKEAVRSCAARARIP